ncbi:MAG: hypothetical protein IJ195_10005 [Lachnospiraceae bacterium]|nr:hypothetical protein [Lachnospiraceae bacterium]MBR1649799.1 hypothetical protein [Lachnospiraceae bacterium]
MVITKNNMQKLLKSQQGELNGVETYLRMAELVHNESDAKTFRALAADEGRHANVIKQYTGKVLKPKKTQALLVTTLYRILGKRILYPLIAIGEYIAIPKYKKMMTEFPELESVKNDEKRHGDTMLALWKNGEYEDKPLLPVLFFAVIVMIVLWKLASFFVRDKNDPGRSHGGLWGHREKALT